jgi:NAD(P)-dependent dehydrogenase (short-subunit alcohol dehydrogenase family)
VNNEVTGKEAHMSKVAVVTGAASGIGRAVVERLAEENFTAVILDINEEGGREVAGQIRGRGRSAEFIRLDVTQESAVKEVFQKIISDYGCIDVLVNVAGGTTHWHTIAEFPLQHWQETIDLNLTSTFLCCREVIGAMKKHKSGSIINTSSDLGFTGGLRRAAYSTAKAGIVGFSKCLALELAPFGVRVNVIAPGRAATARVRARYSETEWTAENEKIPLKRAAEPADIAEVVAFLANEANRHMTGQTIHVNGGRSMW